MIRRRAFLVLLLLAAGCGGARPGDERVLLVTTTSVEDSGLLEALVAGFEAAHPEWRLRTLAVGSGAALELGRRGDGDLLLTHDPDGERAFMAAGHGVEHGPVMENRFVIVGPPADPAGVAGAGGAAAALGAIARAGSRFLSRGDDSGTHRKERSLWRELGLEPWTDRPAWYAEAGSGMAETLLTADQLQAYALSDESSFLHLRHTLALAPLHSGDDRLTNPYSYILPARPVNPEGARVLIGWLTGPGQEVIARHGADTFGQPLFRPTAAR